jgi:ABC-2 type transport system ATP-binding protein
MARDPEGLRARIGFAPETPPLYEDMGVCEFLTFVAHIRGMTGNVAPAVDEALAALDLTSVADAPIATLSHGYRRRVGIAQAIVNRPELILLDEPTGGLDPVQVVQMRQLILGLRARHAIMLSSHALGEVQKVCDRILVLQKGRIAVQGSEAELAARLAGNTTVTLEVRGARAALEQALAPTGHRLVIDSEKAGITRATVELRDDAREELVRILVEAGLGVRRIEPREVEIESIFLALTRGGGGGIRSS